jgi:hypothetical protein
MTDSQADRQKDIETLLAERKKYEAWLAQLEAKRSSAAAHVYDRVLADYTKRLDDVRSRLRAEADTLRSLVSDLEARLAKELDRVTRKSDERAEAELRAMVGEYSDKEWGALRGKLDSAIADLRAKFDSTERELVDLKDLLASVTGVPAPARASVIQAAAVSVDDALAEAAADAPGAAEAAAQPTGSAPPEAEAAAADESPADVPEAESPAPVEEPLPPRAPTPFDELAFLRSVAGTPSRPSGMAAVPSPSRPSEPPQEGEPDAEPPASVEPPTDPRAGRPRAGTEPPDPAPLGGPTPRTSQAIRSLKCQECGTLNFPTEWYCERCGGELAAF